MKKFLFLGAMAAMLLGTASCSNDMEPQAKDGEALVQYTVTLGDGIDSRTISDGTKANTLKFAVFTEDGQHLDALDQEVPVENKSATITTKLARYHTYKLVFWAQNSECDAYDTSDMSAIKVNYTTVNCNDETRDAFYEMRTETINNTDSYDKVVVLNRPFAQINFLASDAAGVQGLDAYTSKVTVTGVPTQLNTLDGTVAEPTDVTFDYAALVNEDLAGYESYKYVAMNYILAATNKELKNTVELTVNDGTQDVNVVTVNDCPVQRNYRTNIFGDLFTVEGNFNITIDPIYNTPDYEVDPEATVFNITTNDELDAALHSDAKKIVINLPAGEFEYKTSAYNSIPGGTYGGANTQSITIKGAGVDQTTLIGKTTYWSYFTTTNPDCVLTLQNMSINSVGNSANTWDAYDYAFSCPVNAVNVKFLKPVSLCNIGKKSVFKNVIIDATNTPSEAYAIWQEAGTDLTLDNCTINGVNVDPSNGRQNRCLKISDQYISNPTMSYLVVKNSTFMSDKKAAILVGSKGGANITVDGIDITGVVADQTNAVHIDKSSTYANYHDLVTVTGATCIVEP